MSANTLPEGQVLIPNARLGYPKLYKAEGIQGDPSSKPRFGCQILLPKTDTKTKARLDAEIERIKNAKFKDITLKSKDLFIKDGDGDEGDKNTVGCWVISANRAETQGRPQVIDRDRKALMPGDGKPYAGCYCNFLIGTYAPSNWKKICASIEVVQFAKDGEPFGGGRVNIEAVMPDLSADDEDGDDI